MMKDSTYHSRSPHCMKLKIEPVRLIWPRSTANTPIWQVTLDATSTMVFAVASGRSRSAIGQCKPWPLSTERIVKYIANSAAKNISSLDSQIMVPTLTRFGLLAGVRGTCAVSFADAVATMAIITTSRRATPPDPPSWLLGARCNSVGCRAMKVVVYSHDADTRAEVKLAIGRRPAPDVPEAEIVEVATEPALFRLLDAGQVEVMVLDGEAQPAGGMGVCRQAKDEIHDCPPVLLIIGRPDDGWLATWSGAEAVVSHPIEPRALAAALAGLMRQRSGRAAAQA